MRYAEMKITAKAKNVNDVAVDSHQFVSLQLLRMY